MVGLRLEARTLCMQYPVLVYRLESHFLLSLWKYHLGFWAGSPPSPVCILSELESWYSGILSQLEYNLIFLNHFFPEEYNLT